MIICAVHIRCINLFLSCSFLVDALDGAKQTNQKDYMRRIDTMTDISKYANISLPIKTYERIKSQSEKLCGVKLSASQTVTHAINLVEECMETGLIPTAFHKLEPTAKKFRFSSIRNKLKNLINPTVPTVLTVVGTAVTNDEIEARNKVIYHNRVVADRKMTLQQLGTMYNITRERVRQIQEKYEVSPKTLTSRIEGNDNTNTSKHS